MNKRTYSERAKQNHRDGMELRMGIIHERILSIKKEIKLYEKFGHTKFAKTVLRQLKIKLTKRTKQLQRYTNRKTRLKKEGKI